MSVISVRLCEIEGEFASVYVWMYVCLCIQVIIWEGGYVWAWMLICVFVSDKHSGNGISGVCACKCGLHVSVLCLWVICSCVCALMCVCVCVYTAICCVLIWTCRATWYSMQLISCLSSTRMGITTGKIESLRSWEACMQMREIYLFFLLSFHCQPSHHPFLFFCPSLFLIDWSLQMCAEEKKSGETLERKQRQIFSAFNKTSCPAALLSLGVE